MSLWKKLLTATSPLALTLILAVPAAFSVEKLDLDRQTPVPDGTPIPALDFFRPLLMDSPQLNPSGTHIAALIAGEEDNTQLMVYDLRTQKVETAGSKGDSYINSVTWLNDNHIAYGVVARKFGASILSAGELGVLQNSYPLLQNVGAQLISVPPKDRLHPVARLGAHNDNSGKYGLVVQLDALVTTGKMLDLTGSGSLDQKQVDELTESNERHIAHKYPVLKTDEGFDLDYYADKEGGLAFGTTSTHGQFTLHRLTADKWENCPQDLEEIKIVGTGDNPGELVVVGPRQEGKPRALQLTEGATGKVLDVLLQDKAYDFNGWLYRDPASHNIVGAVYDRDGPHTTWFTEPYHNLQKAMDGLFPGKVVRILGTDEGGKTVLISAFSDRQPPIYSWVDLEKHSAALIKNSAPWIDPKRMRPMSIVKFKTRDGHQLDAYVTMPAGATKQNPPPLVVLPHDYAPGRSSWGFNPEAQFYASRGYAVLQPNYRSSAGYSGMFPTEDEWAYRKIHEDVTDATKTLIASGLVDGKRVAIIGTSFGGYLALAGAAFEPDLYRCVVAVSPVADWARQIQENRFYEFDNPYYSRLLLKLGDPKKDQQKFDAMSPLRHADQIHAALLISKSEYDPTFQTADVKDLASAAERNHASVEWISFLNDSNGVHHLRTQLELYGRIEAFLAKNLQGAP